jgi:hypothetical protein
VFFSGTDISGRDALSTSRRSGKGSTPPSPSKLLAAAGAVAFATVLSASSPDHIAVPLVSGSTSTVAVHTDEAPLEQSSPPASRDELRARVMERLRARGRDPEAVTRAANENFARFRDHAASAKTFDAPLADEDTVEFES